ncbi:hypothetical protein WJX74_009681 [Apatococcus lobatus]|uniref:Uncharacterized protein n=1 Tax=Apatococcus lobatus TaxID=904363 RepID=A0AAW1PV11_9CHLO
MESGQIFAEYLLGHEWPEAAPEVNFPDSLLTDDPEALSARLTSPLTLPDIAEELMCHRLAPLNTRVEGYDAKSVPTSASLLPVATGAAQQRKGPVQVQKQDSKSFPGSTLNPQPGRTLGPPSTVKLRRPVFKPSQQQITKRKAPGIRASRTKASGAAAAGSIRRRQKWEQLPVIQEGVECTPPAAALPPVNQPPQLPQTQGLPSPSTAPLAPQALQLLQQVSPSLLAGVSQLAIPGSPLQSSCMPNALDSLPCIDVQQQHSNATCTVAPGSRPRPDGFMLPQGQHRSVVLNNLRPQAIGPGSVGSAETAHAQRSVSRDSMVYHASAAPSPVSACPLDCMQATNGDGGWPITPPQLADRRSQATYTPLHERTNAMLEEPYTAHQVQFTPVQGIEAISDQALQQPHTPTRLHLPQSAGAAATLNPIATYKLQHRHVTGQDYQDHAGAYHLHQTGQDGAGMSNEVIHAEVPAWSKQSQSTSAGGQQQIVAASPGPGHTWVQDPHCSLELISQAGTVPAGGISRPASGPDWRHATVFSCGKEGQIAQPSLMPAPQTLAVSLVGMSRPTAAAPSQPAVALTASMIDRAKAVSGMQVVPQASPLLPPSMIPGAARDMEGTISAACCMTQAPSVSMRTSSCSSEAHEVTMQQLHALECSLPACFPSRPLPRDLASPHWQLPMEIRPHQGRFSSLPQPACQSQDMSSHNPRVPDSRHPEDRSPFPGHSTPLHLLGDQGLGESGKTLPPGELIRAELDKLSNHNQYAQTNAAAAATEAIGQAAQLGQGSPDAAEPATVGLGLLHQPSTDSIRLGASVSQSRHAFIQELEPLPMWDEFAPVPMLSLKKALLEGQLDLEIPFRQLKLTVPLRVLIHNRLPGLIEHLLQKLRDIAPGCQDISTEKALTREVLSTMGDAMCMLIVLGDTRADAVIAAQGFHVRDPGRPAPPGMIHHVVAAARLTPVQVAHTRLLHYKHTRQAEEAVHTTDSLSMSLAAACSRERVLSKRASYTSCSARLRRSLDDHAHLESEQYMQMQQAFCLQVLSTFQAAKVFAAAGPYNLDVGHMIDLINTSHAGPLA